MSEHLLEDASPRTSSRESSHGFSIRRPTQADDPRYPRPESVYLIYVTLDDGARLKVSHYYSAQGSGGVVGTESDLVAQARAGSPPIGRNFRNLVWREPCYLTLVIDVPGWQLSWGTQNAGDPIVFVSEKNMSENGVRRRYFYDPNYSFLDAVPVTPGDTNGLRCINHFKQDAQGNPLGPAQVRHYCFEIYLEMPFASGQERIAIIIDPDGQNQGPPGP